MRQQLVQNGVRFSTEHMEAIRQHFNEAQRCADNSPGSGGARKERGIKLLLRNWGSVIEQPLRGLTKDTELLLPDWRAVAATFILGAGLMIIFGIYLLPNQ